MDPDENPFETLHADSVNPFEELHGEEAAPAEASPAEIYDSKKEFRKWAESQAAKDLFDQMARAPAYGAIGPVNALAAKIPAVGKYIAGTAGYGKAGEALAGVKAFGARALGQSTAGAVQGAEQGAMHGRENGQDYSGLGEDAAVGGVLGPALGLPLNAAVNWAKGPLISEARAKLAQGMNALGVKLRGNQVAEAGPFTQDQVEQVTRAAAKTFGEDLAPGEGLTEDVMTRAHDRIGSALDSFAKQGGIIPDALLDGDLAGVEKAVLAKKDALGANATGLLSEVKKLKKLAAAGQISGETYATLTQRGSELDNLMHSATGDVKHHAGQLRDALDDVLERSNPWEAEAIQEARKQFKNLMTVKPIARKGNAEGYTKNMPNLLANQFDRANGNAIVGQAADQTLQTLASGNRTFFNGAERNGSPWSKRWYENLKRDVLGGGSAAAALMYNGVHPGVAAGLGGALGVGGLANQMYRDSTPYANALIRRALAPKEVPLRTVPKLAVSGAVEYLEGNRDAP